MARGTLPYRRPGDHAVMCDICGGLYYASQTTFDWKNQRVCKQCWEPRNPQEMPIMVRAEKRAAPNPRVQKEAQLTESITDWSKVYGDGGK